MLERPKTQIPNKLQQLMSNLIRYIRGYVLPINVWSDSEIASRLRVIQLLDYYRGVQKGYLHKNLGILYDRDNFNAISLQPCIRNIVRYITNTLANTFLNGVQITPDNPADTVIINKICEDIELNNLMATLEKLTFLTRTAFVVVGWNNGKITANPQSCEYVIVSQDPTNLYGYDELLFAQKIIKVDENGVSGFFFNYTNTGFKIVDEKLNTVNDPNNPEKVNPYGFIPVVIFRDQMQLTAAPIVFPGEELITAQDELNILLTEQAHLIKMQSFSQPVFLGEPLAYKGHTTISTGPVKPLVIALSDKSEQQADFKFETPQARLSEVNNAIASIYNTILDTYGIQAGDSAGAKNVKSAEAIRENNATINEYRNNVRLNFIPAIKRMFDIIIKVYNTHAEAEGLPMLSGEGVSVSIQDSKVTYANKQEEVLDWTFKLQQNLATPVDYILAHSSDMTYDDAQQTYFDNLEFNSKYVGAVSGSDIKLLLASASAEFGTGEGSGGEDVDTENVNTVPMAEESEYIVSGSGYPFAPNNPVI